MSDFTSLQAQREACSAYISSQSHKGWTESPTIYEDPAVSGATLERPGMQALVADVEKGTVDVVVVYKLDRLSRSLLDFVRLLETFDKYRVSFVCITQNFDTADSLGRLVMNVLLTFAQFERELAADRIRDKKRLMTAKGMWSGGRAPLGYDLVAHRLVINEAEAKIVRHIYEQYVALRSMKAVARNCRDEGLISKISSLKDGRAIGGCPLRTATVRNILRNPIYVGELRLKEGTCAGLHKPIVSRELWTRVGEIRESQIKRRVTDAPEDLFGGLTFDCFGRRMRPDRRYLKRGWVALYTSYQTDWARNKQLKRLRINAQTYEKVVLSSLNDLLEDRSRLRSIMLDAGYVALDRAADGVRVRRRLQALPHAQLRSALRTLIERIEVSRERIIVQLRATELLRLLEWDGVGFFGRDPSRQHSKLFCLNVPCIGVARMERRLCLPIFTCSQPQRPNRRLVNLIRDVRAAQAAADEHRKDTPDQLAARLNRSKGHFMRLLRLNYLAPDIVASIHDGTQPPSLKRTHLLNADLPLDWALQRQLFGFPEQPPLRTSERY